MAHRTHSLHSRHTASRSAPARNDSASKHSRPKRGFAREERLRRERELHRQLELRDHPPTEEPQRVPRVQTQNRRRPIWKTLRRVTMVVALIGLVELGVASLTAEPFEVKKFEITGCEVTDESQVEELAQSLIGQNWIRASTKKVEQKIEKLPAVQDARVARVLDWPPHLHVKISERQPFAKVGAGSHWWVVDKSGMAFRRADGRDQTLHAVTSPKFKPELGSTLAPERWLPVVEITEQLRTQGDQGWTLRRIYFDRDGSAALRLSGGFHDETLVRLGTNHWSEKLERARHALSFFEQSGKRAAVLNLVSYEMPQWTPRAATEPSPNPSPNESNNGTPISARSQVASIDSET